MKLSISFGIVWVTKKKLFEIKFDDTAGQGGRRMMKNPLFTNTNYVQAR